MSHQQWHATRSVANPDDNLRMMIYAALLAALIAVGAYLTIPVGPVPIVMQNLFVLLAGLLLGGRWATISVGIYLLAGACGLPVFSGGGAGLGRLLGPTGGYLIGFVPAALLTGWVCSRTGQRLGWQLAAMIAATLIVYGFGVPWLMWVTHMPWGKALALGMFPFLIGDALKIAVAVPIARTMRPLMRMSPAGHRPSDPQTETGS